MKLSNLYQVITSNFGFIITWEDIKDLQRYLKRQESQDAYIEFIDKDESIVDI